MKQREEGVGEGVEKKIRNKRKSRGEDKERDGGRGTMWDMERGRKGARAWAVCVWRPGAV